MSISFSRRSLFLLICLFNVSRENVVHAETKQRSLAANLRGRLTESSVILKSAGDHKKGKEENANIVGGIHELIDVSMYLEDKPEKSSLQDKKEEMMMRMILEVSEEFDFIENVLDENIEASWTVLKEHIVVALEERAFPVKEHDELVHDMALTVESKIKDEMDDILMDQFDHIVENAEKEILSIHSSNEDHIIGLLSAMEESWVARGLQKIASVGEELEDAMIPTMDAMISDVIRKKLVMQGKLVGVDAPAIE